MKDEDSNDRWLTLADIPARPPPPPSGDPNARIAPGRFSQFMEYMMVHRDTSGATVEYSEPINFLFDDMEMPTDGIWNSSEQQKD
ncbi:hypothetical protein D3C71_156190 [compost metagenome]